MNPETEKFTEQRATLINELTELTTRSQSLTTDINRIEGILIYLNQKDQNEVDPPEEPIEELTPT
tara:strand:+ start:1206 stop:1400 length:195 start_codon:yes stop_codon:yes gene_type:complete